MRSLFEASSDRCASAALPVIEKNEGRSWNNERAQAGHPWGSTSLATHKKRALQ